MLKLMVLYRKPEDPAAFMKHFTEVHLPLAKAVPGLVKIEAAQIDLYFGGPHYVLISELYFPDRATFDTAMQSPENRAAGADLAKFAPGMAEFLLAEVLA
jgi:uncharacterized protein (TIGR02118 family)